MKGNYPEVSIVVPCFNVSSFLERFFNSVLNQTFANFELFMIDDGSTDETAKIIKDYASNDKRIKYVYQENQGAGSARNKGIHLSSGDYLCFVDPDDTLDQYFVEKLYFAIKSENGFEMACCNFQEMIVDKIGYQTCLSETKIYNKSQFTKFFPSFFYSNASFCVWNKIYQKAFLEQNQIYFPDNKRGQDYLFSMKVYRYLSSAKVIADSLYHYYRLHHSNKNNFKFYEGYGAQFIQEEIALSDVLIALEIKENALIYFKTIRDLLYFSVKLNETELTYIQKIKCLNRQIEKLKRNQLLDNTGLKISLKLIVLLAKSPFYPLLLLVPKQEIVFWFRKWLPIL